MGRFSHTKPLERCLNPVTVYRDGLYQHFPCGCCEACLLDKANNWSMRLCSEIEATPYSIFFTLTYNNKYVPKLLFEHYDLSTCREDSYYSAHKYNIRFDGTKDVLRDDDIRLYCSWPHVQDLPLIQRFDGLDGISSREFIAYASKRDIQLWLKLIRKDINIHFNNLDDNGKEKSNRYRFRYYIVSEYGPTTLRPHYHGLLFFFDRETAEYALQTALYQNWKMCDKRLFDQYVHFCDSGAAQYVTNYVTCAPRLPSIFKDASVRPFRLASKAPSIGFVSFVPEEIFENIFVGSIEYVKTVSRIESEFLLPYPSDFMHRLFPKCKEYRLLSYQRLLHIYGFIFKNVVKRRFSYDVVCRFLREKWPASDYYCAVKCYQACLNYRIYHPSVYLHLLDMYYYKEQMCALRKFYQWQELHSDEPARIMFSYTNFRPLMEDYPLLSSEKRFYIDLFFEQFGLDAYEYSFTHHDFLVDPEKDIFRKEVEDILEECVKMPKVYELTGLSPHIV